MMTEDYYEASYLYSDRRRIHRAIVRDDCELLKKLLQNGEDPNIQDGKGNAPLHYLLSHNSELVETLVNYGANVNCKNKYGKTPLHTLVSDTRPFIKYVRLDSVKMLLEKGANVNCQDCNGATPLHDLVQCILHNDWHPLDDDICDLLLAHGANIQLQDLDGYTSLHLAVSMKSNFSVNLLASTSVKSAVNISNKCGDYPLNTAARNISFAIFTLLLDNGAIINCKNKYGRTPLHDLVTNKDPSLKDARLKSVKMLLEKGASVNAQDYKGSTPLHDLVQCTLRDDWHPSDDDICDLLLGYGADVQLQDLDGYTSLHHAVAKRSGFIAKLLESTSGKSAVNIPNKSGDFPIHTSFIPVVIDPLKLLLDNGAKINSKNGEGQTALHLTSHYFRLFEFTCKDLAVFLLQRGAEVNSQDKKGRTPLDYVVKLCVEYCEKYAFNRLSPLHQYIDILLDWGASFGFEDAPWKSRIESSPFFYDQIKYEIRKTCLGLPPHVKKQVSPVHDFQNYEKYCCKEVIRMKAECHGNISLYDIFHQHFDPLFLSNDGLVSTLQSTNLKERYPIYGFLLSSTYHRSKERVQLFDSVSTILQTPLPFEMMRFILSFVDDESLRNVVKANELF